MNVSHRQKKTRPKLSRRSRKRPANEGKRYRNTRAGGETPGTGKEGAGGRERLMRKMQPEEELR